MDHLWTPWRYAYVTSAESAVRRGVPAALDAWPGDLGCVFCNLMASIDYAIANGMDRDKAEAAGGLILRAKHCFICLNAYPVHIGTRDGDALRAPGPAGGAAQRRPRMS